MTRKRRWLSFGGRGCVDTAVDLYHILKWETIRIRGAKVFVSRKSIELETRPTTSTCSHKRRRQHHTKLRVVSAVQNSDTEQHRLKATRIFWEMRCEKQKKPLSNGKKLAFKGRSRQVSLALVVQFKFIVFVCEIYAVFFQKWLVVSSHLTRIRGKVNL